MAVKLPLDIHYAFHRVVHDYPEGVAALAIKMGIPPGTLYNKANTDSEGNHKPTLADGVVASLITGDRRILEAFSHAVGQVCFSLPDMTDMSTDALMLHLLKIENKSGDFYRKLHAAIATNDSIDRKEFSEIKLEAFQWIAAILESLARMKEMSGGDR